MTMIKRQQGFNLIELMVAMVIGVFLVAGALSVYTQSQSALIISEQAARLQENARYALQTIERDVRAVDLWGLTNNAADVANTADPTELAIPLAANSGDCEPNWSVNLGTGIEGSNNVNPYSATCIPTADYVPNTDVLVLRHAQSAEIDQADLQDGTLYIRSSSSNGVLFEGPNQASGVSTNGINSELTTVAYWIADTSEHDDTVPSLRRTFLTSDGSDPVVVSEEVIAGIEDLQVQYGIDTTGDQSVNMYVDFDDVVDPAAILVARVWLRVRAEQLEQGFNEDVTYRYADKSFKSADTGVATDAKYRRLLVTKTIELRNRRAESIL